jgi:putative membrane protein
MMTPVPVQVVALKEVSPKKATLLILTASAVVFVLLIGIIYGHGRRTDVPEWVAELPFLNAVLNGTSAVFLTLAWRAIKRRDILAHARFILISLASSALFLVSYIVYHSVHGDTKFLSQGFIRPVYFSILVSHILLSAVALPLIFLSLFFSLSGRFPKHKKIARLAMPVWLYVSVTGVLVFVLLKTYG